ncbi:MAG: hypothetical protein NW207_02390 [Cytophagales bacterium]|nr:hypothetical protein [Cytophagales bacterium]
MNSNNPEHIKAYIRKHKALFWYTPKDKVENISIDFLVEQILNYGDTDAVRELFEVVGLEQVRNILENTEGRKKGNYFPDIYNFFLIYTKRHALS